MFWPEWKQSGEGNCCGCSLEFPACSLRACPVLHPLWPPCPLYLVWGCVCVCVYEGWMSGKASDTAEGGDEQQAQYSSQMCVCVCICVYVRVWCVSLRKHLSRVTVSSVAFIWPLSHQVASWFTSDAAPLGPLWLADWSSSCSFFYSSLIFGGAAASFTRLSRHNIRFINHIGQH